MLVQGVSFSTNNRISKVNSHPVSIERLNPSSANDTVSFRGAKLNTLGRGLKDLYIGLKVLVIGSHKEEFPGDGKLYSKIIKQRKRWGQVFAQYLDLEGNPVKAFVKQKGEKPTEVFFDIKTREPYRTYKIIDKKKGYFNELIFNPKKGHTFEERWKYPTINEKGEKVLSEGHIVRDYETGKYDLSSYMKETGKNGSSQTINEKYHPDKHYLLEETYKSSGRDLKRTYFEDTGKLASESESCEQFRGEVIPQFLCEFPVPDGYKRTLKTYSHQTGNLIKSFERRTDDLRNLIHQIEEEFYENGTPKKYKKKTKDSLFGEQIFKKEFYENGNPSKITEENYKNKIVKEYNENGNITKYTQDTAIGTTIKELTPEGDTRIIEKDQHGFETRNEVIKGSVEKHTSKE